MKILDSILMHKDKFFYLHIPKTAGSSINKFLTSQFEEDECLTHIESRIDFQDEEDVKKADTYKLLSGHIQLPQMQQKLKVFNTRTTIATFRIPIEHVVSHLCWVRKLGEPSEKQRLMQHNKTVQKIVAKLVKTDLSNASEITKLIVWLEKENIYLFHDTQTRYLCSGQSGNPSPALINQALLNLNRLDYVGTVERLDEFFAMLCYKEAWKLSTTHNIKENTNESHYGLDIKDETINKALQPLVQWDNLIYRVARERFIDDMHAFLAELEKSKLPRFSSIKERLIMNQFINKGV